MYNTHLLGQELIGHVISANVLFFFEAVRAQCAKEPRFASFWFCVTHIDGFYIIHTDLDRAYGGLGRHFGCTPFL